METLRYVHPRPRLAAAMEMLRGCDTLADIGCDHGRLSCAAVQSGAARRAIAIDISLPSLAKAQALAAYIGVDDRVRTRQGDGFMPLAQGEADAVALLGMGGTLMTRLLEACPVPLMGARTAVLQPMRAVEDIRRYLYARGYRVRDDRVVREAGRLYQVFAVAPPEPGRQALPAGWPADCFCFGYTAFQKREPLLKTLVETRLQTHQRRLQRGESAALTKECEQLTQILRAWEETACN